jgi:hypothetical protein
MNIDGRIAFLFEFLGKVLKFTLILRPSLFEGQRSFLDFVVLMSMEILQIVFQTLTTILGVFQLSCVVLELPINKTRE